MKKDEFKNMHEYQSEIDAAGIWAAIEPEVDALNKKRKKRRGFIFWFWSVGIFCLMAGSAYWIINEVVNKTENHVVAVKNSHFKVENDECEEREGQELNFKNQIPNSNTEKINAKKQSKNSNFQQASLSNTKNGNELNKEVTTTASIVAKTKPVGIKNPKKQQEKAIKKTIGLIKEEPNAIFPIKRLGDTYESIPQIPMIPFADLILKNELILNPKQQQFTSIKRATEGDKGNRNFVFSIKLQSGLSFVSRQLRAKSEATQTLLQLRENTESILEAHHYGIQLVTTHQSGFSLNFGINQTTIAERFDYLKIISDTSTITGVKIIYTELSGELTDIYDTIPLISTTTITKKIYNSYKLLDLPILLGYSRKWKNWQIGASAGVFVNLSLQTEGKIMNGLDEIIQIETQTTPIYKSKLGLAYYLGFSLEREISPNIQVSISSFVKKYTTDFTNKSYGLSQQYTLFGGTVGLSYQFGK